MIIQCCVCRRIRINGKWVKPNKALFNPNTASHGYCASCAEKAHAQLEADLSQTARRSARSGR